MVTNSLDLHLRTINFAFILQYNFAYNAAYFISKIELEDNYNYSRWLISVFHLLCLKASLNRNCTLFIVVLDYTLFS